MITFVYKERKKTGKLTDSSSLSLSVCLFVCLSVGAICVTFDLCSGRCFRFLLKVMIDYRYICMLWKDSGEVFKIIDVLSLVCNRTKFG